MAPSTSGTLGNKALQRMFPLQGRGLKSPGCIQGAGRKLSQKPKALQLKGAFPSNRVPEITLPLGFDPVGRELKMASNTPF